MRQTDNYTVTTGPTTEPVTLTEAKSFCRITHSAEDSLISGLLSAAVSTVENYTNQCFIERDITGDFSGLECSRYEIAPYITIRRSPLTSISSVTVELAGVTVAADADSYEIKKYPGFSRLVFIDMDSFESDFISYPVQVKFTAGYGDAADVPDPVKTAIKQLVCLMYSSRGDCLQGKGLPDMVKSMLGPYRILNTYG